MNSKHAYLGLLFVAANMQFATAQTNTFPNTGNVGVGVLNPLNGLHLFTLDDLQKGSIRLGHSGSEDAVISFGWNGTDQDAFRIQKFAHMQHTNPTDLLYINANGNTGIGTTSPRGLFDVGGSGDIYLSNSTTTGTAQAVYLPGNIYISPYNGSNISYLQARRSDNSGNTSLQIRTYNSGNLVDAMLIDQNGNVGIGTNTPNQRLTIKGGGIGFDPYSEDKKLYSPSDGLLEWMTHNWAPEHGFAVSHQGDKLVYLNTSGNSYLNGGNVGIGTTTPQEKLSVNGKIRAKEIKVEATGWPDYVFEDGYQNRSLAELEAYIRKNRHLPEVPSAKEVKEDGVALGEMNKILLKKIEELTLYIIEMKKEMELLKSQN